MLEKGGGTSMGCEVKRKERLSKSKLNAAVRTERENRL